MSNDPHYDQLMDAVAGKLDHDIKPADWDGFKICVSSCPSRGVISVHAGAVGGFTTGCRITQQPIRDDGPVPVMCPLWYACRRQKDQAIAKKMAEEIAELENGEDRRSRAGHVAAILRRYGAGEC
jgi:hypothetical protein